MVFVGSGYTYLQEWLPNVGQYTLRHGMTDFVGLGRMMLSYPELAGRCARRQPAHAQARVPDVQRLHDRARGSVWSRAATRSIRSTSRIRTRRPSRQAKAPARP